MFSVRLLLRFHNHIQKGSEPYRTCMDSELYDADWKVEADDDVEGASFCFAHTSPTAIVSCFRLYRVDWQFRGMPTTSPRLMTRY